MKRYSKQRETILEILQNTKSHPTAAAIYEEARKTIPNISLGTVYRNLSELDEAGAVISINVAGGDHFDGMATPHPHLYCRVCQRVIDIEIPFDEDFVAKCAESSGIEVDSHSVILFGKCYDCCKKG